jgi:hypothetical protein
MIIDPDWDFLAAKQRPDSGKALLCHALYSSHSPRKAGGQIAKPVTARQIQVW